MNGFEYLGFAIGTCLLTILCFYFSAEAEKYRLGKVKYELDFYNLKR